MKFLLVESLTEHFNEIIELEYDASDIDSDASGTVRVTLMPSDVMENLWDFITEDKQQLLSEQEYELYAEDDDAWEQYVINNFDMLWERYEDDFYNKYKEQASEKLYDNFDNYSDVSRPSQRDEDIRNFWRDVWGK